MKQSNEISLRRNQAGLVSIVVTVILILVISLITLSFAQVIRREQRKQLDRQLSSRAFYAAESGVNLAASKLNEGYQNVNKTNCGQDLSGPVKIKADDLIVDAASNTQVTCLTINQQPTMLEYTNIGNRSRVFPLDAPSSANPITTVTFSWQATVSSPTKGCAAGLPEVFPTLIDTDTWNCGQPLLRVDLVTTDQSLDDVDTLRDSTFTAFLYPRAAGAGTSSVPFNNATAANQGAIIGTNCDGPDIANGKPKTCTLVIDVAALGKKYFSARVMSLYGDSELNVYAKDAGGNKLKLAGAQAIIDSTAKANDVLRRIQVRKSLTDAVTPPDYAITTGGGAGLCKRYQITATIFVDPADDAFDACKVN